MSESIWSNSSYLDLTGSGVTTATTPAQAYGIASPKGFAGTIDVALVLPRISDPTALLASDYAEREAVLDGLSATQVGALYGADPAQYDALVGYLSTVPGASVLDASQGLVSSAQSRTVWVQVDSDAFDTLFGTPLMTGANVSYAYWNGNLTPNASLGTLAGLWVADSAGRPPPSAGDDAGVTLVGGPQGVANTAGGLGAQTLYPNAVAAGYEFPLNATGNLSLATPTIGLIEPGVGAYVPPGSDANQLIQAYRAGAGVSGTGTISEGPVESPVAPPAGSTPGERALDVGVIAAAAPNSDIVAFAGGDNAAGVATEFPTLQEAIWGGTKVADISTSFQIALSPAPGSPFYAALQGLYVDAALNNIAVFADASDGGSSNKVGTGLPSVDVTGDSPYSMVVGGTSTSSQAQVAASAGNGASINAGVVALAAAAEGGNVAALETLVAGGLTEDPTAGSDVPALLQTTWNKYGYDAATSTLDPGYLQNASTVGGVDTNLPEPAFQQEAGIDTQALQQASGVAPASTESRGVPDVSALAGGNTLYIAPQPDLSGTQTSGGTSAATPLWAALTAQIQAVFADQHLPALGYLNDLVYQADAIDPGAFDDVRFGADASTYTPGGPVTSVATTNGVTTDTPITPTGLGYAAGPGYDLATGLGTPDGILLARALTAIAQAQVYSPDPPAVSDGTGALSASQQTLIVQPTVSTTFSGTISVGGMNFSLGSDGSGEGWTAQIAQQSLQSYFAPALVMAIAGQAQASSTQIALAAGQALGVGIGNLSGTPTAQQDTTSFGFVEYAADGQSVTLARPLAVAETYGGADDAVAVVRLRQTSADADALSLYRVDDLDGLIDGIAPGQAGYAAAAAGRDYAFAGGGTQVAGPGEGGFAQTTISGVDNGDIIGFALADATTGQTEWGLAAQNAGGANALWSYGADTWGFDDGSAGGAGDDSLVFQLDFTSEAGSGLLVDDATPACFVAGTRIGTPAGDRPIETLAIGDEVLSVTGRRRPIRWIGRRSYGRRFLAAQPTLRPVRFRAGSLGAGLPRRDLLVSPEHAMLLEGVLVPARCLLDGENVVQETGLDRVDYLHLELEEHDVILAEGAPSESFVDDDSRGIFHNAAEYRALYPDAVATPARYCTERLHEGERLAGLCRRLAERRTDAPPAGALLGWIDVATPTRIVGWARDGACPSHPVRLLVSANDVVLGCVLADLDRADVRAAGHGDGRCGFELRLPEGLDPRVAHRIAVHRAEDGAALPNSPLLLRPPPPGASGTATLRGRLDAASHERVQGWAWDPGAPHAQVALQVVANGSLVATGTANRFRADLAAAGIGAGWHGFDIAIPGGLSPLTRHTVAVGRRSDGAALPCDPAVLEPAQTFGPALEQAVQRAVAALGDGAERERLASFMLAQAERLLRREPAPVDAGASRRALVIDERLPDPDRDAGSQAVLSHMHALRGLGFSVAIAAAEPSEPGAGRRLREQGFAVHEPPLCRSVEEALRRDAGSYDLVYLHRAGPAARYIDLVRAHQPRAHVVYAVADLHHVRLARQAALLGDDRLLARSRAMRRTELALASRADAVITHSTAEAALLRRAVPGLVPHCVGWTPVQRRPAPFARRRGVAFIGSFAHAPNLDALAWLIDRVMTLVWAEDPGIPCLLAGSDMPASVRRLAGPGIEVLGHVADPGAVLRRARLSVAPLRFGAGLKGKVLESLAAGLPCAMTPVAAEGFPLPPALHALVGQDAAALAAIVLRLHRDGAENRRLAAAGRRMVARHYGTEAVLRGLRAAVDGDARPIVAARGA